MIFRHVRSGPKAGVTICSRPSETQADGQWVLVGASFSSPKAKFWDRKKACAIAKARAFDSPLQLKFEGLDGGLQAKHVEAALRTLAIEGPAWVPADMKPLRPGRFTQRYGTTLLGPNGSLLTAYIDVKPWTSAEVPEDRLRRKVVYLDSPPLSKGAGSVQLLISHWALRIPSWARDVLEA